MGNKFTIFNKSASKQCKRLIKIPKLTTIFKSGRNSFDTDPRIQEWIDETYEFSGLNKEFSKKLQVTAAFTSYFHPLCKDIQRYKTLVKFWALYFIIDDQTECDWGEMATNTEKAEEIWAQVLSISERLLNKDSFISMSDWRPYNVHWFTLFENICEELNDVSKMRLFQLFNSYCTTNIEQTIDRIEGKHTSDSLEALIKKREHSSGVSTTFGLIEYAEGIRLTEEEWDNPLFQDFFQKADHVILYHNDIISFEKEWLEQKMQLSRMSNTVAWTALSHNCLIQEAMDRVCAEYPSVEKKAMEAMEKLLETEISENVKTYVEGVSYMLGGNFTVGYLTPRYNNMYD